jgi:hypothetical protein
MGKHNNLIHKKISFVGITAGAFGVLFVAAGIFSVSSLNTNAPSETHSTTAQIPRMLNATHSVAPTRAPTSQPVSPTELPTVQGSANNPRAAQPNLEATVGAPEPLPMTNVPNVNVGVDTDVHVEVPLLDQTASTVDATVTEILNNINGLLGN